MEATNYGLSGRVVIITGVGQGIGEQLAHGFAAQGCRLALIDYVPETLDRVTAEIRSRGAEAQAYLCDLRSLPAIQETVARIVQQMGAVDVLVNDAAWTATVPFLEVTEEQWDQTVDTGFKGLYFLSQAVARHMVPRGKGVIIHLGSQLGQAAFKGRSVYGAMKAGVHHLTRCMALELGPLGIRVNAVAPCITETATRRNLLSDPAYVEWVKTMLPVGRWAQPEDIVGPTLFLASDQAAMVLGHVFMVDGGWTIH